MLLICAFTRRYAQMRSVNDSIYMASWSTAAVLYIIGGCFIGLFFLLRQRWVLWRGALIVSIWFAFALTVTVIPAWPMLRDYFVELMRTQDPQALLQKMNASLQTHGFDYPALALNILQRVLQPLLGIAFVVLYLDSKGDDHP